VFSAGQKRDESAPRRPDRTVCVLPGRDRGAGPGSRYEIRMPSGGHPRVGDTSSPRSNVVPPICWLASPAGHTSGSSRP